MKKHIRIAVEELVKRRRKYIFDAILYDNKVTDNPHAKNCSERVKMINLAIKDLENMV